MSRLSVAGIIAFALMIFALPASAAASTITVTTTADQNNAAANNGLCSFREAIYAASNNVASDTCAAGSTSLDTIVVPAGDYKITGAASENANANGDFDLTGGGPVLVDGGSGTRPVLDGNSLDRVLDVTTTGSAIALKHVEVDNGKSPTTGTFDNQRGGGLNSQSPVTITDCLFKDDNSAEAGGAIGTIGAPLAVAATQFTDDKSGTSGGAILAQNTLAVTGSQFTGNQAGLGNPAFSHDGGAIDASGPNTPTGQGDVVSIVDSSFTGNSVAGTTSEGGAVSMSPNGTSAAQYSIHNSAFTNNQAQGFGGGIYFRPDDQRTLNLDHVTIDGNSALPLENNNGSGGGLDVTNGFVNINNSTFSNNQLIAINQQAFGGGISADSGSVLLMKDSVVAGNNATGTDGRARGGGIYGENGYLNVLRSTVSGNSVDGSLDGFGGGIAVSSNPVDIVNSTLSGDSASPGNGGGIAVKNSQARLFSSTVADDAGGMGEAAWTVDAGSLAAQNSILASDNPARTCSGTGFTSSGTNVGTGTTCNLTASGDKQGSPILNLTALADNGGPAEGSAGATSVLQTMATTAGSAAVDNGNASTCVDQAGQTIDADERGVARFGASCDTGSFEKQADPPLPSNRFTFGKLKLNRKKGTGTLQVKVPGPGVVTLAGSKAVVKQSRTVKAASTVNLPVKAKGKAVKALRKKGSVKLSLKVQFQPTGGKALLKTRKVKLVRKKKHRR